MVDVARYFMEFCMDKSCGKCLVACPTGANFRKGSTAAEREHGRDRLQFLVDARENKQWNV